MDISVCDHLHCHDKLLGLLNRSTCIELSQNPSSLRLDHVICISSFIFSVYLRIKEKKTPQKLLDLPEVKEKFLFPFLGKVIGGSHRREI